MASDAFDGLRNRHADTASSDRRPLMSTRNIIIAGAGVALLLAAGIGLKYMRSRDTSRRAAIAASLMAAIRAGDAIGVEKILAKHAINVNEAIHSELPLIAAIHSADADAIAALINAGADINVRADGDTTPLMAACTLGKTDLVRVLLKAGAKTSLIDEAGFTASHIAAKMGHLECLKLLGSADASTLTTPRISDDATPLMFAAAENHVSHLLLPNVLRRKMLQ